MRKELLGVALALVITAPARADVLSVPEGQTTPAIKLPSKGMSRADLEKGFGEPRTKQKTVGGDSAKHPPITRWDYDGFSVIFERDRVVDVVVPGAPPKIFHKELLGSGTVAAAPAASTEPAEAAPAQPEEAAPPTPASDEPAAQKVTPKARQVPAQGP